VSEVGGKLISFTCLAGKGADSLAASVRQKGDAIFLRNDHLRAIFRIVHVVWLARVPGSGWNCAARCAPLKT